jgi:hypothetical protein
VNGARHHRYWRLYRTAGDRRVIHDELHKLPIDDYANIRAAMHEVVKRGL